MVLCYIYRWVLLFSLRPKKNGLQVWRHRKQRLHQKFMVPTFKSRYQTVSVWGVFSRQERTPLVGTVGIFDRHTYHAILDNHILPFTYEIYGGWFNLILQEENCGLHRAKFIATYPANEEVRHMKWPSQNPDLSPIENIWGLMRTTPRKRLEHTKNSLHLFHIVPEMWNTLPDIYFMNLVASIPERVEMVRRSRGGSTKH